MELLTASIDQLEKNPWNPNAQTPLQFNALKESLRRFPKVLEGQRIIVWKPKPDEDKYQILNGEHRWRACRDLIEEGRTEFAVIPIGLVTDIDEATAKLISLALANVGEEDYEKKVKVIVSIKDEISLTDIANTIGADQKFIDIVSAIQQPSFDDLLSTAGDPLKIDNEFESIGGKEGFEKAAGLDKVKTCDIPMFITVECTGNILRVLEYAQKENLKPAEVIQLACKAHWDYLKESTGEDGFGGVAS
jgi:ParB-like chromosome segregation protein Spo0J